MMRNKKLICCFNILAAIIIPFCTCGFGPSIVADSLKNTFAPEEKKEIPVEEKYQDPLLPYIYAENKISKSEFETFLKNLNQEQCKNLWKAVTGKEPDKEISIPALLKEMNWQSSHWITYKFHDFDYHETVKWTAEKLGVHKAVYEYAHTFQLEHDICEKLFERMWDRLPESERIKLLDEANLDHKFAKTSGAAVCVAISTTLAAGGVAAAAMGFAFYILMAKTTVVFMASLGVLAPTTISAISLLCGPVGWCIAAGTAVTAAVLTGQANVQKCAAMVVQIHMTKIDAMRKSGVNYEQYLLPATGAR